jgi:uncharacterized protein YqjF (DUF2071 family)
MTTVGRRSGWQRWRHLAFLHWPVPVETLRPLVPARLALDLWQGTAYVGVVPFAMEGVRAAWMPEALALSFLETNVRTYVRPEGGGEPGVWFFSLDAASRLAVWTARTVWRLPYFHAAMETATAPDGAVSYRVDRDGAPGARLHLRYRPGEHLGPSPPGTLEHFLLERYFLYVERRGVLYRGQVHHTPYPAQRATVEEVDEGLVAAAGIARDAGPPLAHYAAGVDVEVSALVRVAGGKTAP